MGSKNNIVFAICAFLLIYVGYVLFANFKAEVQREKLISDLFTTEVSHIKRQTEFLLNFYDSMLKNLSIDRRITAYFGSKRMGMSEAYGLWISKMEATKAINERFCHNFSHQSCFTDLAVIDKDESIPFGAGDIKKLKTFYLNFSSHSTSGFVIFDKMLCNIKNVDLGSQLEGYVVGCLNDERFVEEFRRYIGRESKLIQGVSLSWNGINEELILQHKSGSDWSLVYGGQKNLPEETDGIKIVSFDILNNDVKLTIYSKPFPKGLQNITVYILAIGATICLAFIIVNWRRLINQLSELNMNLIQKAKEAEEASRAKTNYVSYISHEIRTPLNYILGYAQIMLNDPSIPEDKRIFLQTIVEGGELITRIINQTLDIAKLEAGIIELKHEPFRLEDCLEEIRKISSSGAIRKGVNLYFDNSNSQVINSWILGDKTKIQQIIMNLLSNAIKLTPAGKEVRVKSKLNEQGHNQVKLIVEVCDSGPGLTPEEKERIFMPFYQTDQGSKAGGTGLGLYFAYKLTSMMGGDITLESEIGKGTKITAQFILEKALQTPPLETFPETVLAGNPLPSSHPIRILVCDDDSQTRSLLRLWCEMAGFTVEEAENGKSLFEKLNSFKPDLVLLDIILPDTDGIDCLRRIRYNGQWKSTKVIALTGKVYEGYKDRAIQEGVDGFIIKPVSLNDLLKTIASVCGLDQIHTPESHNSKSVKGSENQIPVEITEELKNLILKADIKSFTHKVENYKPVMGHNFALFLLRLAREYRYQEIIESLEKGIAEEKHNNGSF